MVSDAVQIGNYVPKLSVGHFYDNFLRNVSIYLPNITVSRTEDSNVNIMTLFQLRRPRKRQQ